MAPFNRTVDWLKNRFTILNLGAIEDTDLGLGPFSEAVTLIELDAVAGSCAGRTRYLNRIAIHNAVSGKPGKRTFFKRRFDGCSSFLEPDPELIKAYGLEWFYECVETLEFDCDTLASILKKAGVGAVDFIKTDLEGLDFEVLSSAPEIVGRALVIQAELRFEPFYRGEPSFDVAVRYLADLGFELLTIRPEAWKYRTRRRHLHRDGRLIWGDFIFFAKPSSLQQRMPREFDAALAKQIVLARALGFPNYAERLLELHGDSLPAHARDELAEFLRPRCSCSQVMVRCMNGLASFAPGLALVHILRRILHQMLRAATVSGHSGHLAFTEISTQPIGTLLRYCVRQVLLRLRGR